MATKIEDSELLRETAEGDERAFSVLICRHKGAIKAFIYRKIGEKSLTEDLCQETIIKIYSSIRSGAYIEQGLFRPYALRIAANIVIDHIRRHKELEENFSGLANDTEAHISEPEELSAEDEIIARQDIAIIRGMVRSLPQDQKKVIVMHYYQGCSFNEIAERTGVSIGTALGRAHYAIKNMRKMVKEGRLALAG